MDLQILARELSVVEEYIVDSQTQQARSWAELQFIADPVALHAAITEQLQNFQAAVQFCRDSAERVSDCIKDKDNAYVRTLQQQADQLDRLLRTLEEQASSFNTLCKHQIQAAEQCLNEVGHSP